MKKMWVGRTKGDTSKVADAFNSSINVDKRMYKQDILGSIAHAKMLSKQNIISKNDANMIIKGLEKVLFDIQHGKIKIPNDVEDIHMFVEYVLTQRIGEAGKKLHTARSRNDQVTLDLRMYLNDETNEIINKIKLLISKIVSQADKNNDVIMPGYTHMQHAQPILFSHHILSYAMMLLRDVERFKESQSRILQSPIGSCALAGTTYKTDREYEAKLLGFKKAMLNSIDGVSDRDYCLEFLSNCSILMMHLSRLSEELIIWSTSEFAFVSIDDAFTTGSSIMPQKKNPDMAELVRGKIGRVYGNLFSLLTICKSLPLAYNKDMQEDKEAVFDSLDTIKDCLDIYAPMISTLKINKQNMAKSASVGFMNATDLADYLAKKGKPFRSAYKITGEIVSYCIQHNKNLSDLTLKEYKKFDKLFSNDLYKNIDINNCVQKRNTLGGTSTKSVQQQIKYIRKELLNN